MKLKISPFVLLCVTGLFAIFSSTISKSPVLPLFASHIGAQASGVGIVASISAFTGIIASIPAGIISDKIGRKRMLFVSLLIFSTAPFLYLFVSELWQLALVRFYHGFATAIFVPVAMAMVADLFNRERGEKMGWFSTSTLIGRFVAPIVGGGIIGFLTFEPDLSYRVVYLVCGIAGVIALLLSLRLPSERGHQDSQSVRAIKSEYNKNYKDTFSAFRTVLSNKTILITAGVEASILFAYGTFETFLPLYSISKGISPQEVGIILSAQIITLALTKPAMGRFSDRHGRHPQIITGALIGAVSLIGLSMSASFISFLTIGIVFGLSLSIVTSATSALIADLSNQQNRGSAMGLLGSIMDIGHTAGPLISGIVALQLGYEKSFLLSAVILAITTVVFAISLRPSTITFIALYLFYGVWYYVFNYLKTLLDCLDTTR